VQKNKYGKIILFFIILLLCNRTGFAKNTKKTYKYTLNNADFIKFDVVKGDTITTLTGNVDVIYDSIRFYADNAQIFQSKRLLKLNGNAKAVEDTLEGGAENVWYNYDGKILNLRDSAYFQEVVNDSISKKVTAEEIDYFKLRSEIKAKGNIEAKDFIEKVKLECGDFRYDHESKYGSAKIEPVLKFEDREKLTIRSKQMEIFSDKEKLTATYDVVIEMKNSFAKGKFLIYFNQNQKSVLLGNPKFQSESADASAQEFELFFKEDKLDSLFMSNNARIYFKKNESDKKSNFLFARSVKLDFEAEKLLYMNAIDVNNSFIRENKVRTDNFYINKLKTAFLEVFFDKKEEIEKVVAEKQIEGVYKFEQKE